MGLLMIRIDSNIDWDRMAVKKGLGLYCSSPSLMCVLYLSVR
jgi:hypothetical protein